jgi:hypothetical protein
VYKCYDYDCRGRIWLIQLYSDRQLNLRPDLSDHEADEDDERIGTKFLWDFEEDRKRLKNALLESKEQHDVDTAVRSSQEPEGTNVAEHETADVKNIKVEGTKACDAHDHEIPIQNLEASPLTGGALVLGEGDAVLNGSFTTESSIADKPKTLPGDGSED